MMSISETFHQKSISTTLLRRCDLSRNLYRNGDFSVAMLLRNDDKKRKWVILYFHIYHVIP